MSHFSADAVLKVWTSVCSCFVACWAVVTHRHFLLRIRIATCFTNSRRSRRAVMFEDEHAFWLSVHHVCTCVAFERPSNRIDVRSSPGGGGVIWERVYAGVTCFHFSTVVRYCCWFAFLNGTHRITILFCGLMTGGSMSWKRKIHLFFWNKLQFTLRSI